MIGNPFPLKQNVGKSFQGSIVLGKGFVLSPQEAEALIAKDTRNKDVLYPYLNGDDLNNDPQQKPSRWVINFLDWSEEQARTYPDCFEIVERWVKPERLAQKDKGGQEKWWQFLRPRNELYKTISQLDQVMVLTRVSKYVVVAMLPAHQVFMEKIVIKTFQDFFFFSILQSTIYNEWAWKYSSTLGGGTINYSPSTCFDSFPFPFPFPISKDILETKGKEYYTLRQAIMKNVQIGLTKLYNFFHDKAYIGNVASLIKQLRDLHVQIDLAILNTYGWSDISPRHDFYEVEYLPENDRTRFTFHPEARREVMLRLLELNHNFFADEQAKERSNLSSINQNETQVLFD